MRFVSREASFSPKVSSEVRDPKPMPAPPPKGKRYSTWHREMERGRRIRRHFRIVSLLSSDRDRSGGVGGEDEGDEAWG